MNFQFAYLERNDPESASPVADARSLFKVFRHQRVSECVVEGGYHLVVLEFDQIEQAMRILWSIDPLRSSLTPYLHLTQDKIRLHPAGYIWKNFNKFTANSDFSKTYDKTCHIC